MSLILEALRKSEAERRRGRAPDLHAELPPAPAARRRLPMPWFAAIAIAAVLLLAATVFWPRDGNFAALPPVAAQHETASIADDTAHARRNAIVRDAQPPERPSPHDFPRIDRIAAPGAAATIAPPPAPAADSVPASPAAAPGLPADTPAPPVPEPALPLAKESTRLLRPATAPAQVAANEDAPIRYTELAPAERQQLPPMKLTMHMWNERSAQRFVIFDGQRYGEGDRIGSGLVAAIDPDGMIIELNGRRVRVPLR